MTTVIQNLDKLLNDMSQRLYSVEQRLTSPNTIGRSGEAAARGEYDELFLGAPGNLTRVWGEVSAPTGLAASWGSFFDTIYVDASWIAPADGTAIAYQVDFAKKISGVYQIARTQRVLGTSVRIEPVEPDTTYAVRVSAVNRIERQSATTPWVEVVTGHDATTPPTVLGVSAEAGFRSAVVKWSESGQPVDVTGGTGLYEVQISTSSTFATILDTQRISGSIVGFDNLTTSTTYYFRVAAIDSSGNQGPYSGSVNATTAQAGTADISDNAITAEKIIAGSISSDKVVTAGLDAAVIKFGTMSGDRITANTLDVSAIKTSTLVARDITLGAGGQLKAGSPPTTGLLINDQGISLYSGGTRTVYLDAVTGAGSFTGTISGSTITGTSISSGSIDGATITGGLIRTAATGARISLGFELPTRLHIYTGQAIEVIPAYFEAGSQVVSGVLKGFTRWYSPQYDAFGQAAGISMWDSGQNNAGRPSINIGAGPNADITIGNLATTSKVEVYSPLTTRKVTSILVTGSSWDSMGFVANNSSTGLSRAGMGVANSAWGQTGIWEISSDSGNRWLSVNGAQSGFIDIVASAFTVGSSITTKSGVVDMPLSLDKVKSMRPVKFDRPLPEHGPGFKNIPANRVDAKNHETGFLGFIAEEVEVIAPELVSYREVKPGGKLVPMALDLTGILALAVKSIQELDGGVQKLEARITVLESV